MMTAYCPNRFDNGYCYEYLLTDNGLVNDTSTDFSVVGAPLVLKDKLAIWWLLMRVTAVSGRDDHWLPR